jgi:hypothetical protein
VFPLAVSVPRATRFVYGVNRCHGALVDTRVVFARPRARPSLCDPLEGRKLVTDDDPKPEHPGREYLDAAFGIQEER